MNRRLAIGVVVVICVAGFLVDVASWARAGHRSIGEVLLNYWWAVLFVLSVGIAALAKRGKGA